MSFTGFQLGLSDDLLEASRKVIESSAEYKKFFDATLKKFGVTSPDELSNEKKKEFFDYIDKNYNSDDEKGKDGKVEGYGKKKAVKEEINEEGPCWKGYKQVGVKEKNGKEVPNCVPMNEEELKEAGIDKSEVDYSHIEEDIKLRDVEGITEVIAETGHEDDEHDQVPTPTPSDEDE